MIRYRAAWVLPIRSAPIAGGVVAIERDIIAGVGPHDGGAVEDLGNVAILPGLVNAHTHLELSWMRGQVARGTSMPAWAASLMALRRTVSHEPPEPIAAAIVEARASGTCLVGDVTNTFATYDPLLESELSAALFRELLGFSAPDPDALVAQVSGQIADLTPIAWLRPSIVPHAPYSVSPALLQAIARWSAGKPLSIHLGESAQEVEFLRDGTGEWRALLEALGVWNPSWTRPGVRAGGVPRSPRDGGRTPARRPRRAVHGRGAVAPGGRAPPSSPARAATGGRAPASRRSIVSTRPASASRSAPTAWPASTT